MEAFSKKPIDSAGMVILKDHHINTLMKGAKCPYFTH